MGGGSFRVFIIAALLAVVGTSVFLYKWRVLGFPLQPDTQTQVWTVEVTVNFEAGPGPIKADLYIPGLTPGFAILEENFLSRGFGFTPTYVSGGRQVQWARRRARGDQTLYYRAVVYNDPQQIESDTTPPFPPIPRLAEPFNTAMEELVEDVGNRSADPASFTVELLKRLSRPGVDQNVELLLGPAWTPAALARTATTLLAAARIPARTIRGIYLQDQQRRSPVVPWLEIHDGTRWSYFDPLTGRQGLPDNFLLWWRGDDPLFKIDGGSDPEVRFSVQSNYTSPIAVANRRSDFMPVLIALAFRETQLLWGVVLFSSLVTLGLLFRVYLEHLRLLLVPRLSAVLIIVVLLMLTISVISHQLGFETGLSLALFPMVILAMTIERMSVVWEERGSKEAIQQGLGSLVVAAACYAIMDLDFVKHLVFVFPEILLLVLAATLLIGRYTGYRLMELYRFREFRASPD
jgi:hypothetical protein